MIDTESNNYYTQNDEERAILEYFGDYVGTLVDVGANDGITFSNSARLIELGWKAHLIEPHYEAFCDCSDRYANNSNVRVYNYAIVSKGQDGRVPFYASKDSLLSSLNKNAAESWGMEVEKRTCEGVSWSKWIEISGNKNKEFDYVYDFDFISIDAEQYDYAILKQIDLTNVKMVCFEQSEFTKHMVKICQRAGMKQYYRSFENLIYVR